MPDISEIVDVTITVQSAALSRKGFNSLMIVGTGADFGAGFLEYEVRSYSTASQLGADADILPGNVTDMATVAFAQSPSVSEVYISRIDSTAIQEGDLVYSADLVAGDSINVNINGTPIAGSPIPFNTNVPQTLNDIGVALLAETEVGSFTDNAATTIFIDGATVGESFTVSSNVDHPYVASTSGGATTGDINASAANQLYFEGQGTTLDWTPALPATGTVQVTDNGGAVWQFTYGNLDNPSPVSWEMQNIDLGTITKDGVPIADMTTFAAHVASALSSWVVIKADVATATFVITAPAISPVTSADLNAIAANDNSWFGFTSVFSSTSDVNVQSAWVAANKKYGFFRTIVISNDLNLNSDYSSVWYTDAGLSGTAAPLEVAIASRILAEIPGSYTAAFKSLQLVSPTQLNSTNEAILRSNRTNQYTAVSGRNITWDGVTTGSGYIDIYVGVLYLEARIAEDVFGYMASVDKVPYTNAGIDSVVGKVQARLDQSVVEQFLAGDPQPLAEAPRVTEISATDKSNRLLPNVTFTATASGAVHTVQIIGTVIA